MFVQTCGGVCTRVRGDAELEGRWYLALRMYKCFDLHYRSRDHLAISLVTIGVSVNRVFS